MHTFTEDNLIENPEIQLMEHELGWDSVNAWDEWATGVSNLGREAKREVVLTRRLKPALQYLNAELPAEGQVDFDVLEKKFAKSKTKNLEAQKLWALIERKLDNMIRLNASRYDYLDRFQKMFEPYNSGALSIEQ